MQNYNTIMYNYVNLKFYVILKFYVKLILCKIKNISNFLEVTKLCFL